MVFVVHEMNNLDYLYTRIFSIKQNNTVLKTGRLVGHIETNDIF
jgi:hypothetical protein